MCARDRAQALKAHPEVQVRMGIHSGPVSEVTDVSGRTNIAGAGINMAQRVMDCGDAGHILLSRRVAEDLEQYRQWSPSLHDLGECEVKHGVRVSIVNLFTNEVGNSAIPTRCAADRKKSPPSGKRLTTLQHVLIILIPVISSWHSRTHLYSGDSEDAAIDNSNRNGGTSSARKKHRRYALRESERR